MSHIKNDIRLNNELIQYHVDLHMHLNLSMMIRHYKIIFYMI